MVFDALTMSLAVQVWLACDDLRLGRVYLRRSASEEYRPVGAPESESSDVSLVTSGAGFLFFLRQRAVHDPGGWAWDNDCIVRVRLPSADCDMFPIGEIGPHLSVFSLHGASLDGSSVFATIAIAAGQEPAYSLARISLLTHEVEILMPLRAVFI